MTLRVYVAGAWTEQHTRARPMIARLKEAGAVITMDWTQAEGDVCACGHAKSEHSIGMQGCAHQCGCDRFNGIGVGSDSALTPEQRRTFAHQDLDGVLSADVVWLLAANGEGASGSWVELGAALAMRTWAVREAGGMRIIVSGAKNKRTIFTEIADKLFHSDEEALAHIVGMMSQFTGFTGDEAPL